MSQAYFITGTDTDVGKTFVSKLLLEALNAQGYSTIGFKPISAGCEQTEEGLRNDDALVLQQASSLDAPYAHVNPIAFAPPIAPHIAAQQANSPIQLVDVQRHYETIKQYQADRVLIEGAGGWRLPLNSKQFLSDFAIQNQMQVVLVVGMRLGCLNHALLSYQAIEHDRLECVGWIANQIDPNMDYYAENLASLKALLPVPMLAEVPFAKRLEKAQIKLSSEFELAFSERNDLDD